MVLNDTSPDAAQIILKYENKSFESDDIRTEIHKCCSPEVEEHLSKAFNECLKIGIFS